MLRTVVWQGCPSREDWRPLCETLEVKAELPLKDEDVEDDRAMRYLLSKAAYRE